jgi:AcrR family transcriptional regulator
VIRLVKVVALRADARKNRDHLLHVAAGVIAQHGVDASLRDIARKADVGFATLCRHYPTREDLLEALLREQFDDLARNAEAVDPHTTAGEALVAWLEHFVACAHNYRGAIAAMAVAIEDPQSALHASCVAMRAAGSRLLERAQSEGMARTDVDGADLYALGASLAWLSDQPSFAPRAERLTKLVTSALLVVPGAAATDTESVDPAGDSARRRPR